jgi:uncharacterized protein (DUF697 family)/tellurite resistance protein
MNVQEQRALLAIALLAAFADGSKSDAERAEVRRIAESLGAQAGELNMPQLMQDVLLKRVSLAASMAALGSPAQRQLAYELAVCVCDADGVQSDAERQFLATLREHMRAQGDAPDTAFEAQADALARETDSVTASMPAPQTGVAGAAVAVGAAGASAAAGLQPDRTLLDRQIYNRALLCGALELLPQSWASMAIIPLQVKLVHAIGQAHGHQLDATMVKEFIATAGVGLTGQYIEQFGRKLVGGLLGKVMGGIGRGVGSVGTGMAMSFATTYALGQLALRYYGGGRQMSTALLQQTYQELLGNARQLQQQALPQIQQQARGLNAQQVLEMVRRPLA